MPFLYLVVALGTLFGVGAIIITWALCNISDRSERRRGFKW